MYWLLHIVGRDVRGRTNYSCVQLSNILFEVLFVRVSPAGSSVSVLVRLEDARIQHVFNSVFLLIYC